MSIKALAGNGVVAFGGYVGAKTAVLASAAPQVAAAPIGYAAQFHEPYSIVGLMVPNWLGVVLYVSFLVLGTIFGGNQDTPVDDKFTRSWLKPIYSLVFGAGMTLFVVPLFYPDITIWGLILPALFFATIGAVAIYFIIAFFTSAKLWTLATKMGHDSAAEFIAEALRRAKNALLAIFGGGK